MEQEFALEAEDLHLGYNDRIVLHDLNFSVKKGEIFGILGNSGCGKSTLLKHLIGIFPPLKGKISLLGEMLDLSDKSAYNRLMTRIGVTYQGGALFGSMTVAENVALPLELHTDKSPDEIAKIVSEKLALVDLADFGNFMPGELSGGMRKRAGLARAIALDPQLLFFDEPSAGLDPLAAAALDSLILSMRRQLGVTVVIVTHELDSIYAITDRVIIIDKAEKTIVAEGDPRKLRCESENLFVRNFLNRNGMKRSVEHYG
ncbi:MAG: ATP-binding cassette domain-containing protein [Lentisphaeria bacterium]|nr:ATP-binding cassette domain-containing protein [Lentisphaeria bacterium]